MENAERLDILRMVDNGDVSVDEALRMMSAQQTPSDLTEDRGEQRWLHVRVGNLETGAARVSVNVPVALMRWGLGIFSQFAPELHDVDLDTIVTDLDQYAQGRILEVESFEDNQRVEIFVSEGAH
jgi:hypothetical protein